MRPASETAIGRLEREAGMDPIRARLLAARQVDAQDVQDFLQPTLKQSFPDPSSFTDMDRAVEIILDAIASDRSCAVFADYDVDGGTAAAILIRYFRAMGRHLQLYVPDRIQEGYGPSPEAFATLKARGVELIITVDCGAAAVTALESAQNIGVDIVVIDHHLMHGAIPHAAALVNPNRPDCQSGMGTLTAAGVAFVLAAGLNRRARARGMFGNPNDTAEYRRVEPDIRQWGDLAALGTLCDVAPLRGFNRAIVTHGLKVLSRTDNPGLRALSGVAGLSAPDKVWHATFTLGPRLNAGGRIGEADLAARLLSSDDPMEVGPLAVRLDKLNAERREIEAQILDDAIAAAERQLAKAPNQAVIVVGAENWHPGVVGIVAARLKEKFFKPAIAVGWGTGFGPYGKGSGRSIEGVNLGAGIAKAAQAGLLIAGGGHAMAAGLTIEPKRMEEFAQFLSDALVAEYEKAPDARTQSIDIVLRVEAVTNALAQFLETLEPFGPANPEPCIVLPLVRAVFCKRMGADGTHLRVTLEGESGARLEAVAFRCVGTALGDALEQRAEAIHVAGRLSKDRWNGREKLKFEIADVALAHLVAP